MSSSLSPDSSGSSGFAITQRSLSPIPPGVASTRQITYSPRSSRRSRSPFARERSNSSPVESDMNRPARFVANIGGGLKKVFGKKEPKSSDRDESQSEDPLHHNAKTDIGRQMPSGVLAQIREGIKLKKQITASDLKTTKPKNILSVDRSVSYDGIGSHQAENNEGYEQSSLCPVGETDEPDAEVQAAFDRDETDGLSDMELQRQMEIEHLNQKIKRVTEEMRKEQNTHHERLTEYLRVSGDGHSLQKDRDKLKTRFEARNSKSNQALEGMKRKLEKYRIQKKELEEGGELRKGMLGGLKGVKDGIIDGLARGWEKGASGITGAVNLIRRGRMSGSSGNIIAATLEEQASVGDMESEERPPGAAVGGETAETSSLSDQTTFQDQNQLHMHLMIVQLKSNIDQLTSSVAINSKDMNELQSHHDRLSEILHQLEADVKHSGEERHLLQQRLDSEASMRERVEEQYVELCASISEMQQEFSQMQERLERFEYHTGEHFSEADEKLGALDNKLCQFIKNDQDLALNVLEGTSSTMARTLLSRCLSFLLTLVALVFAVVTGCGKLFRVLWSEQRFPVRVCLAALVVGGTLAFLVYRWL